MKFYIASRMKRKSEVCKLFDSLKSRGYKIVSDWASYESFKPYEDNRELCRKCAIENIDGIEKSDVFILLTDEAGTDMYAELGVAILSNLKFGKPKVYVIGEYISRSTFFFHPSVGRKKDIKEVLEEIEGK